MQKVPRLINNFNPSNYKLSLKLNRANRTFEGAAIITGKSFPDAQEIKFHSTKLTVKSAKVNGKIAQHSHGRNDELIIKSADINNADNVVDIKFSGKITDSMHGLYPCYYIHEGVRKELLATQFESHHAREVFPCIDEPEAKATFELTLTTETGVTILSNTPIQTQTTKANHLVTKFEQTPKMSSYLLAWVVGELHKKTAHTKSGVEVNIWATPAQPLDNLDFALDIATRTTDFYDEYFGTPYPLKKCDHVALPDFSSGAMENWGLITYREVYLLADPITTSIESRHRLATVISHELSHQWFGNLVTMKWWNDLWLNESFASLVEYTAIDAIEPKWDVWMHFVGNEAMFALNRDSLDGVQPVKTDVNHPDEINALFDGAIVYCKGARLLQMLENYIGKASFQAGLKQYFKDFAYQNTTADDLWNTFSKVTGKDISKMMTTWITQPGFPVVSVTQSGDRVTLSQKRLSNGLNEQADQLWPIPLNATCDDAPELLETKSIAFTKTDKSVLRLNTGNKVHAITHYDNQLLSQIIRQIEDGGLRPIDRLQFLNEQIMLAQVGIINNAELVRLILAFKDEDNESVWDFLCLAITKLRKFIEHDKVAESKLREITGILALKQFKRLGWDKLPGESETDTKLRATIIGLMSYSKNKQVINRAVKDFNTKTIDNLDPELRSLIIAIVVKKKGGNTHIANLLETYKTTNSAELQQDICGGVTAMKDKKTAKMLLEMIKDPNMVRPQDSARWFVHLIRNRYTRDQTWQWLRTNWEWVDKTFKGDKSYDEYPLYSATALMTRKQLGQYKKFFMPMISVPALTRVITVGINEIENRVNLIERDSTDVCNALKNL